MNDYSDKFLQASTLPLTTNMSSTLRDLGSVTGVFIDDEVFMQKDNSPAWLEVLNSRLADDKNKLANAVIKLAEEFKTEEWKLHAYNKHGVELTHVPTGVRIDAGVLKANVRIERLAAASITVGMVGNGVQLNPLVAAINYIVVNVVTDRLDGALSSGEQGEFKLDSKEESQEKYADSPTTWNLLYSPKAQNLKLLSEDEQRNYNDVIPEDDSPF